MDWDGDGHLDILSGCYWSEDANAGHLYLFRGTGKDKPTDFGRPEVIKTRSGKTYANSAAEGYDKSRWENVCTHAFAVDYDGDGKLDLINGCSTGSVYLARGGEGGLEDAGTPLPMKVESGKSAPHMVDWDGDGDLDLISGSNYGFVLLYENKGSRKEPVWGERQYLVYPDWIKADLLKTIDPAAAAAAAEATGPRAKHACLGARLERGRPPRPPGR